MVSDYFRPQIYLYIYICQIYYYGYYSTEKSGLNSWSVVHMHVQKTYTDFIYILLVRILLLQTKCNLLFSVWSLIWRDFGRCGACTFSLFFSLHPSFSSALLIFTRDSGLKALGNDTFRCKWSCFTQTPEAESQDEWILNIYWVSRENGKCRVWNDGWFHGFHVVMCPFCGAFKPQGAVRWRESVLKHLQGFL